MCFCNIIKENFYTDTFLCNNILNLKSVINLAKENHKQCHTFLQSPLQDINLITRMYSKNFKLPNLRKSDILL